MGARAERLALRLSAGAALLVLLLSTRAAHASSSTPDGVSRAALCLAVILLAANLGGHLAVRTGQVAVLGELLAGVMLGNAPGFDVLRWIREDPSIDMFARFGALLLLFDVGLELTVREVATTGRSALLVAVLGTVASFLCGTLASLLLRAGASTYSHVLIGAALTATSVGITARVLRDLNKTRSPAGRTILGAALIDDVLGLIVLTLVTGWISAAGARGGVSIVAVSWLIVKAAAFFIAAFVIGRLMAPALFAITAKLKTSGAQLALGLSLCFVHAWVADAIGLAPIVGAFTAGLILEDVHSERFVARGERSLRELVEPVSSFLVPVFFVVMGSRVELRALANGPALALAAALTVAAVLGKVACAAAASRGQRLCIATGMIPRGEVTLIYASFGVSAIAGGRTILDAAAYSALVLVVIATTLLTPAALRWTFARSEATAVMEASRAR
jgi:Kef-type K+ transport system membrane component KefB